MSPPNLSTSTSPPKGLHPRKRILLIDDEVAFSSLMKRTLEGTGSYEVEMLHDSMKAEDRAREMKPDLVLLDIIMHPRDGSEVCHSFQKDPELSVIPLIIMSAFMNDRVFPNRPFGFGSRKVLEKPMNLSDLDRLIDQIEREMSARDDGSASGADGKCEILP